MAWPSLYRLARTHPLLWRAWQLQYPPALRISISNAQFALSSAANAIAAQALRSASNTAHTPLPALTSEAAIDLANACFRMRGNLMELSSQARDSKELRSMKRALATAEDALRASGVDCQDVTGQDYDPGRLDFEQIGSAESVPGLERAIIGRSERPVVSLHGKLIQKAKGLVHRPA